MLRICNHERSEHYVTVCSSGGKQYRILNVQYTLKGTWMSDSTLHWKYIYNGEKCWWISLKFISIWGTNNLQINIFLWTIFWGIVEKLYTHKARLCKHVCINVFSSFALITYSIFSWKQIKLFWNGRSSRRGLWRVQYKITQRHFREGGDFRSITTHFISTETAKYPFQLTSNLLYLIKHDFILP